MGECRELLAVLENGGRITFLHRSICNTCRVKMLLRPAHRVGGRGSGTVVGLLPSIREGARRWLLRASRTLFRPAYSLAMSTGRRITVMSKLSHGKSALTAPSTPAAPLIAFAAAEDLQAAGTRRGAQVNERATQVSHAY